MLRKSKMTLLIILCAAKKLWPSDLFLMDCTERGLQLPAEVCAMFSVSSLNIGSPSFLLFWGLPTASNVQHAVSHNKDHFPLLYPWDCFRWTSAKKKKKFLNPAICLSWVFRVSKSFCLLPQLKPITSHKTGLILAQRYAWFIVLFWYRQHCISCWYQAGIKPSTIKQPT